MLTLARWLKKVATWIGACAALALLTWHAWQFVGPYSEGPAEEPLAAHNRAVAQLEQNAAPLYIEAYDSVLPLAPPDDPEHEWNRWWYAASCVPHHEESPLVPEIIDWIDANERCVVLVREAAQLANCGFTLRYEEDSGLFYADEGDEDRAYRVGRFLLLRARLAVEREDLERLTESLLLLNRLTRHLCQHPADLLQYSAATTLLRWAGELALSPVEWTKLDRAALASYARETGPLFAPCPGLPEALIAERNEMFWAVTAGLGQETVDYLALKIPLSWFLSPQRVFGEYDRVFNVAVTVTRQPVSQWGRPANPHWDSLLRLEAEFGDMGFVESAFNLPKWFARLITPSYLRVLCHHLAGVTQHQGNHAVLKVFAFRAQHGGLPRSLDELPNGAPIDPTTGELFAYRLTETGFILYSFGPDRDDDGGRHDISCWRWFDEPVDGDYVFWPLPD